MKIDVEKLEMVISILEEQIQEDEKAGYRAMIPHYEGQLSALKSVLNGRFEKKEV